MDQQRKNTPEVDAEAEFGPILRELQATGQMPSDEELQILDNRAKEIYLQLMTERLEREKQDKLATRKAPKR